MAYAFAVRRLIRSASGATSIEYALIAGVVALVIVSGLSAAKPKLTAVLAALAGPESSTLTEATVTGSIEPRSTKGELRIRR